MKSALKRFSDGSIELLLFIIILLLLCRCSPTKPEETTIVQTVYDSNYNMETMCGRISQEAYTTVWINDPMYDSTLAKFDPDGHFMYYKQYDHLTYFVLYHPNFIPGRIYEFYSAFPNESWNGNIERLGRMWIHNNGMWEIWFWDQEKKFLYNDVKIVVFWKDGN